MTTNNVDNAPARAIFNLVALVTALEYFDFISFTLFSRYIPFAAQHLHLLPLIVGYSGRFIGSILVAFFTKKYGNERILIASIWTRTISTLFIGVLPNHKYSLFFLFCLRGMQGLAFAVEFPSGAIMEGQKGTSSISGATLGYIFASLLFEIVNKAFSRGLLTETGWRIPCFIGGFVGLYVAMQRSKNLIESANKPQKFFKYFSLIVLVVAFFPSLLIFLLFLSYVLLLVISGSLSELDLNLNILMLSILALPFLFEIGRQKIKNLIKNLRITYLRITSTVCNLLSKIDNPFFNFAIYYVYIFLGLTRSMHQTKLVSSEPGLASQNTGSLFIPIIFIYLYQLNPSILWIINLYLFLIPAEDIYAPLHVDIEPSIPFPPMTFTINQIMVTSCMLTGLSKAKALFRNREYLAPVAYNGIALLASLSVNHTLQIPFQTLWKLLFKATVLFSLAFP